jgi:mannose PTS system EIIA component
MIGVVVVSQGALSREFVAAAEHVVGPQKNIAAVCLDWNSEVGECGNRIHEAVTQVDRGAGVIIVADMMGGTPCNLAVAEMRSSNVEVIAGLNLPMLLKLLTTREGGDVARVADAVEQTGRAHIRRVGVA